MQRTSFTIAMTAISLAAILGISACAPRADEPTIGTGPVAGPLVPAPVSNLPEARSFTGGPGVGAGLNTGIGPGPSFNTPYSR